MGLKTKLKEGIASRVMMVYPRSFRANLETALDNAFQDTRGGREGILIEAQREFASFSAQLKARGIEVVTFEEPESADTPDALFPNNWFCVLPSGEIYLFPMMAPSRQREVHPEWIKKVYPNSSIVDLRQEFQKGQFLEGTGSLVFDHSARVAYAAISQRTHSDALESFCLRSEYEAQSFLATDADGKAYYHTNVMMAVGHSSAVVCLESIEDEKSRKQLEQRLKTSKRIIEISRAQVLAFAGNMLQLQNGQGELFWICSTSAWESLDQEQRSALMSDSSILAVDLKTIERFGGGSARCMLAELF